MKLIITIDTEEDNWGSFAQNGQTLKNIERIPDLHQLFMEFKVRPTYLVNYPVATNERSAAIMRKVMDTDTCEIGTHCHPWNTPPFEEQINEKNSMLCNLPYDLQLKKLTVINKSVIENLGTEPVSFRAGRFSFDQQVAGIIYRMNYKVDTSVTPYTSWVQYSGPDFHQFSSNPFWVPCEDTAYPILPNKCGLLEIPVSTEFLTILSKKLTRYADTFFRMKHVRNYKLIGLLDRIGLLKKVTLCPEVYGSDDMCRLAKMMKKSNHDLLHLFFHSTSLIEGAKSIIASKATTGDILDRIKDFLVCARDLGSQPMTLSEYYDYYTTTSFKREAFNIIPLIGKRKTQ